MFDLGVYDGAVFGLIELNEYVLVGVLPAHLESILKAGSWWFGVRVFV